MSCIHTPTVRVHSLRKDREVYVAYHFSATIIMIISLEPNEKVLDPVLGILLKMVLTPTIFLCCCCHLDDEIENCWDSWLKKITLDIGICPLNTFLSSLTNHRRRSNDVSHIVNKRWDSIHKIAIYYLKKCLNCSHTHITQQFRWNA